MSFRKELKFSLYSNEMKLMKSNFLRKDFKELFPGREINSCYFDTYNLDLFRLSLDGIYPRKKLRLRWYNNNKNNCFKEQKVSSIEGRYKLSKIYEGFKFEDINKYKFFDQDYGILKPKILIRYTREYLVYKDLRFTFDFNIRYSDITGQTLKTIHDFKSVLEVKTKPNISNDYINSILGRIDSGFSKYSRGIIFLKKEKN
tara:strand:+ start:2268 stop:2870 length:603 start_codon:yes stop_codon:yes gene_type:complete